MNKFLYQSINQSSAVTCSTWTHCLSLFQLWAMNSSNGRWRGPVQGQHVILLQRIRGSGSLKRATPTTKKRGKLLPSQYEGWKTGIFCSTSQAYVRASPITVDHFVRGNGLVQIRTHKIVLDFPYLQKFPKNVYSLKIHLDKILYLFLYIFTAYSDQLYFIYEIPLKSQKINSIVPRIFTVFSAANIPLLSIY